MTARQTPLDNTFLAFDTATESMSVALVHEGRVHVHEAPGGVCVQGAPGGVDVQGAPGGVHVRGAPGGVHVKGAPGGVHVQGAPGGALASAALIPAILGLLVRAGISLQQLDAIAFGRGPGAFTGLRTACSVAQGLAFGAGKPVLPIDTLLAVAEDARVQLASARTAPPALRVWAAMDARMNEVYAAQYGFGGVDGAQWRVLDAPMLVTPQALQARWLLDEPQCVAGNALAAFAPQLDTRNALRVPQAAPRATALLALAQAMWNAGGAVDAALALPLYVRDKVAQTTLERDAARALKAAAESVQ